MENYRNVYGAGRPLPSVAPRPEALLTDSGELAPIPTLENYKKHAARFGAAEVYETAKRTLQLKDLIELIHALRALPPTGTARFKAGKVWSLDKAQREELTERMEDAGYNEKAITRVVKG